MGRRASTSLAILLVVVLASASCFDRPPELVSGAALPSAWLSSPAEGAARGAAVVWVFRTADCLSCQSIDYIVRRLYAGHGDSLRMTAVHVGDQPGRTLVDRFLTSRRVALDTVVTVSPRQFGKEFSATALPVLLVVNGGKVEWSSAIPQGVTQLAQIDSVVRAVNARTSESTN